MRSQLVSGERILCTQGGIFVLFQDSLAFDSLTVVYLGVDLLSSSHLDFVEILGYRDYCTPGVRFQEILCKFLAIISLVSFCSSSVLQNLSSLCSNMLLSFSSEFISFRNMFFK